jgi:hypothetical protein
MFAVWFFVGRVVWEVRHLAKPLGVRCDAGDSAIQKNVYLRLEFEIRVEE